jgi:hypothetical protein
VRDRSRVLHGTWPTLTGYLHESRSGLAGMARFFLINFAVALDDYCREPEAKDTIEGIFARVNEWRRQMAGRSEGGATANTSRPERRGPEAP